MMRKPRILIVMHYLELGGAEAALIGLLQTLDPERVDVDLFLYDRRGELVSEIPEWVNRLPQIPAYSMLERPIKELLKKGFFKIAFRRLIAKRRARRVYADAATDKENYSEFFYAIRESCKSLPGIAPTVKYDLAISFLTPHFVVLDKVRAKRKIGWIHTDYTKVFVDVDEELKMWSRLDVIVSISSDVTKTFCEVYPSMRDKITEIENILSPDFIRHRAELIPQSSVRKELGLCGDDLVLLTIGRFSPQKKLEEVAYICKGLRERGLDVRWFIIGYGNQAPIDESIVAAGMQKYVKVLGKRSNPYPYIKACDVYVQPSRYEGKSIVVREAQILGKPVIITNYPTAASQVTDGRDGFIVPMPVDECVEVMSRILKDGLRLETMADYNASHDFGNECEVEKVYSLI